MAPKTPKTPKTPFGKSAWKYTTPPETQPKKSTTAVPPPDVPTPIQLKKSTTTVPPPIQPNSTNGGGGGGNDDDNDDGNNNQRSGNNNRSTRWTNLNPKSATFLETFWGKELRFWWEDLNSFLKVDRDMSHFGDFLLFIVSFVVTLIQSVVNTLSRTAVYLLVLTLHLLDYIVTGALYKPLRHVFPYIFVYFGIVGGARVAHYVFVYSNMLLGTVLYVVWACWSFYYVRRLAVSPQDWWLSNLAVLTTLRFVTAPFFWNLVGAAVIFGVHWWDHERVGPIVLVPRVVANTFPAIDGEDLDV